MPLYFFNVRGGDHWDDPDGTRLADGAEAHQHAVGVAPELMAHCEAKMRHLKMEIRDEGEGLVGQFLFAQVDTTIEHMDPDFRQLIEKVSATCAKLGESLRESRIVYHRVLATRARLQRRPYLIARNGLTLC